MADPVLALSLGPLVTAMALLMAGAERFRWLLRLYVLQSLLVAIAAPRALVDAGPVLPFAILTLVLKCSLAPPVLRALRERYPPRLGASGSKSGLIVAALLAIIPAATLEAGSAVGLAAPSLATLLVGAAIAGRRTDPLLQLMGLLVVDNAIALAVVGGDPAPLTVVSVVAFELILASVVLLLDRSILGDVLFADARHPDMEDVP